MGKAKKERCNIDHIKGNWTVAELSISYNSPISKRRPITTTNDAYNLIKEIWDQERFCLQEQLVALFFNRVNKMVGYKLISTGTMRACLIDVKLIVSLALVSLSEQVIIVHNHPSGNLKPSSNDELITKKIKDALALIEVKLIDHFIITQDGFLSLAEENWL